MLNNTVYIFLKKTTKNKFSRSVPIYIQFATSSCILRGNAKLMNWDARTGDDGIQDKTIIFNPERAI